MWKALSLVFIVISVLFLVVFLFGSRLAKVLQWIVALFIVAAVTLAFKPSRT